MKAVIAENVDSTLTNFEEHILLPILTNVLKTKKGEENAVTYQQIVNELAQHKVKADRNSIKRVIYHIRINHLIFGLIDSYNGYYIATSEEELIAYKVKLRYRELALKKLRLFVQQQRTDFFG